ncbi:SUN1 protein, partial [Pseudoatta argentina]
MSARNAFCCVNAGNCPSVSASCHQRFSYHKLIKPFAFCVITSMLAMTVSHFCDKYSATASLKIIKADLGNLGSHLGTLSLEVKNVMEMRDELKSKLKEVGSVIPKMSEAILNLRNEVSEEMSLHTKNLLKALSPETVRNMDYILPRNTFLAHHHIVFSTGGAILSIRDTEPYSTGAPVLNLFGIPLCQQQNTPRAMIQTGVLPGECWAFKGSSGSVVIRLLGHVHVSGVSLEHISSLISPTGETATAPKDFSVWGLSDLDDKKPFSFGSFMYDNTGSPLQYFEVQNRVKKAYDIIEVKVHSNSGNPEYTCIYRIRVHGTLSETYQVRENHIFPKILLFSYFKSDINKKKFF